VEYFVKWEGLADVENSWEKAQDIECSELLQDFESEARKNPLWKEGSGLCLKRKREELDEKSEKKARRLSKKQTRIPVSQWCHQCLRHKPVIMCCDGVATYAFSFPPLPPIVSGGPNVCGFSPLAMQWQVRYAILREVSGETLRRRDRCTSEGQGGVVVPPLPRNLLLYRLRSREGPSQGIPSLI
jgi:hypothetical protein